MRSRDATSADATTAISAKPGPSPRMETSTAAAIPARATRRPSNSSESSVASARSVAHNVIAAAISVPFGLIVPPRYTTIGVIAMATPATAHERRRRCRADARALASSAAHAIAFRARMAIIPVRSGQTSEGRPVSQ